MDEVFLNTKKYEDIAEKRSVFYGEVDRALEIVKKFILEKNRILYGGMAIDLSLKLAGGEGIYSENAIPDYDFMSPTHYDDSNELAVILAKEGFDNVSAIHAIHFTSRRVRVNFIAVADITYIPENIYEQIPTLTTNDGMRFLHPDFQRLDMHRAFATPFEKPPGEVILQRTKKDIKRFRMLVAQYPLRSPKHRFGEITMKTIKVSKAALQNTVCGGLLAYALFYKFWKTILPKSSAEVIPLECEIEKDDIVMHWPSGVPSFQATIITDHYENLVKSLKLKKPEYYNKYLDDLRPRTVCGESDKLAYELLDNCGRLAPVFNLMKLGNYWFEGQNWEEAKTNNIWLAQVHLVLMYLLLKSFQHLEHRDWYVGCYLSLMTMIQDVEENITELSEVPHDMIPFFLTATCYGEYNWSPDYINSIREKLAMFQGKKISSRGPFGFYPKKDEPATWRWQTPDFSDNEFFLIDGALRKESFEPLKDMFTI
jgi:hypothetical protein